MIERNRTTWSIYLQIFNDHATTIVKPRYSALQGTDQNYALYQGFHYCQHINNYENTSRDQNLYAYSAELC